MNHKSIKKNLILFDYYPHSRGAIVELTKEEIEYLRLFLRTLGFSNNEQASDLMTSYSKIKQAKNEVLDGAPKTSGNADYLPELDLKHKLMLIKLFGKMALLNEFEGNAPKNLKCEKDMKIKPEALRTFGITMRDPILEKSMADIIVIFANGLLKNKLYCPKCFHVVEVDNKYDICEKCHERFIKYAGS